jgi:colicin import membrane protein
MGHSMPRKLKTFVTESGFFELAVAAPSMKAALETWGIKVNLFQQGLARQTDNAAIIAAAEAAPGQVLRRPIGSKGAFRATAELPKVKNRGENKPRKPRVDLKAIRTAEAALERAEAGHRKRTAALDKAREALDARTSREEREWQREKKKHEDRIDRLKG